MIWLTFEKPLKEYLYFLGLLEKRKELRFRHRKGDIVYTTREIHVRKGNFCECK